MLMLNLHNCILYLIENLILVHKKIIIQYAILYCHIPHDNNHLPPRLTRRTGAWRHRSVPAAFSGLLAASCPRRKVSCWRPCPASSRLLPPGCGLLRTSCRRTEGWSCNLPPCPGLLLLPELQDSAAAPHMSPPRLLCAARPLPAGEGGGYMLPDSPPGLLDPEPPSWPRDAPALE